MTAGEQWRVACRECGNSAVDHQRMHTEVDAPGEDTVVECNNCGHRRAVGT